MQLSSHRLTTDEILQHLILVTLKLTSFTSDCNIITVNYNNILTSLLYYYTDR